MTGSEHQEGYPTGSGGGPGKPQSKIMLDAGYVISTVHIQRTTDFYNYIII